MEKVEKIKWQYNHENSDRHSEDPDVHIKFTHFGYETLCGLAAEGVKRNNDNGLYRTVKKVDCPNCLKIYDFCKSIKL